jgi:hypothetical protein
MDKRDDLRLLALALYRWLADQPGSITRDALQQHAESIGLDTYALPFTVCDALALLLEARLIARLPDDALIALIPPPPSSTQ